MNKLLVILILLSIIVSSCNKEQEPIVLKNNIDNLEKDSSLLELTKMNSILVSNMKPLNEITNNLLDKKTLTRFEKNKLSTALGFKSISEYDLFFKRQSQLLTSINTRFPILKQTSPEKIKTIIEKLIRGPENKNIKSMLMDDRCSDILNNCLDQAVTNYTMNILECTAGAIGVGSVTLGIGGIIFQIACGATALRNLSLVQTGCGISYSNCR